MRSGVMYYYCVAYVGDMNYMRGYPASTSPICAGQFCGIKNTTVAEFLQVVVNLITQYIYQDITMNRTTVQKRISGLKPDSYEYKNFSSADLKTIKQNAVECKDTCALKKASDVQIYLKYCMFNLTQCGMQAYGKIKQGVWPVAELNLLATQKIISLDSSVRSKTDSLVDGKTVLQTLFKLNQKIDCTFDNDYDCDGIVNAQDACPNAYNPKQTDTDHDGLADVCSPDIDGDGAKNPIGIVDDNDRVNIKALKGRT